VFRGDGLLKDQKALQLILSELGPSDIRGICNTLKITEIPPSIEQFAQKISRRHSKNPELKKSFGLSYLAAEPPDKPPTHLQIVGPAPYPFRQLKPYQMSILLRTLQELSPSLSRCVLQMPTGTGKTRTAMELISFVLNDSSPDDVVVWLAHSAELCQQALQCFAEVWSHVGMHPVEIHQILGDSSGLPFDRPNRHFSVMGFQKAYSLLKRDSHPFAMYRDRVRLIVVDEAHRVIAPTYRAATEGLAGDRARILGLTATPGRSTSNEEENKALAEFFFNKLLELESPNRQPLFSYLRHEGLLASAVRTPLETGRSYELSREQLASLEEEGDLPVGFLKMVGADDARNALIIDRVYEKSKKSSRIILFSCSVDQSKFIASCLNFIGVPTAHVDGKSSAENRAAVIEDFRQGRIHVLCNYGVLTTGFDVPKIDTVVITRPTASLILYSQMIGRGLRGPKLGGTETCDIVDVIDNILGMPREQRAFRYFEQYWG